ncbi:MAG: sensor histidine kinase [Ferruginibacter sp.]
MQRINTNIGFNDRWVTIVFIPILAFLIPIVFFGRRIGRIPYYTWQIFVSTLIITSTIWLGNRFIMILVRKHYPHFADTKKRIIVQTIYMVIFTLLVTNLLGWALDDFCNLIQPQRTYNDYVDIFINSNATSFFCTLTIVAIYESIFFMQQLKKSVEEAESFKRESLHAQLDALKTQVNPHFLFNNLNTLTALIHETPDHAVRFVQQLSKVYRHILESKDEKTILIKDELEVIKAYTFLLKTRFEENIQININIPEAYLDKKIVPLALQLLLENAIKHNIVSAHKPLQIDIYVKANDLHVTNNLQLKGVQESSTGLGLNNIKKRYMLLTNLPVHVHQDEHRFTVSIPILEQ